MENKKQLTPPSKEDIERLVQQKKGDPSFLFLSIFSFIEAYVRKNFDECKFSQKNKNKDFREILNYLGKYYDVFIDHWEFDENIKQKKHITISKQIEEFKTKNNGYLPHFDESKKNFLKLLTDIGNFHPESNKVRHNFKNMEENDIQTIVSRLIDFSKHEKFFCKEIENLADFKDWENLVPPKESEVYKELLKTNKEILNKYKNKEEEFSKVVLQLNEQEKKNAKLQEEKNFLKTQKQKLSDKNDDLRRKQFDLTGRIKKLEEQTDNDENTKKELEKLKSELDDIKAKKEKQEKLISEKEREIENLTISNESLSQKNELYLKEKEEIQKRYDTLEIEAESIRQKINSLNNNSEQNKDELEKLQYDYRNILILKNEQENQLAEKQEKIDKLNQTNENLSLMNEELKSKKQETENQLRRYVEESDLLRAKIQELEKNPIETEENLKELKTLQEKYMDSQKQQEEQRNLLRQIQEEHLEEIEKLSKDVELYIENANILQTYASARRDYHSRILRLSPQQKEIINDICAKLKNSDSRINFLVNGGPGTGKTLILIKILEEFAAKNKNSNVKLLTYTDSLSKYNQYLSMEYEKKAQNIKKNISDYMQKNIQTFDSYFKPITEEIFAKKTYKLNIKEDDYKKTNNYANILNIFKKEFIDIENAETILSQAIEIWTFSPKKEDYISFKYVGGTPKLTEENKKNREDIWNKVERISLEIEKLDNWPLEFAYYKVATEDKYSLLNESYKTDFLLIDEIQDLSPSQIKIISKLNKKSCVMAGDLNQSVFIKRGLSWIQLGIELSKEDKIYLLDKNFRSTINIQKLANRYRRLCKIKDDKAESKSFIAGQDPEFSESENLEAALNMMLHKVRCYLEVLNFNPEDICIVVPTEDELIRLKGLLSDNGIESKNMSDEKFDFNKSKIVRLSTTSFVKGIDSPIIMLLLTKEFFNTKGNGNLDSNSQMNAIYSCITRSMDLLYVQITKDALNSNLDKNGENAVTKLLKVVK